MLQFSHLYYFYGKSAALENISAGIEPGICLLLGPNGAGKSTLMSVIAGERLPQSGFVEFDGGNPSKRMPETLQQIFFLSDSYESPFASIEDMRLYHAPFYPNFDPVMLEDNLAAFGLTGFEKLHGMSLGMRRKSLLAYALSLGVELLMLDESANGLDINSKKELRRMVSRCVSEEQTLIISTHTVADLEMLFDRVLILNHGKLVLDARVDQISEKLGFVDSPVPVVNALYLERDGAMYHAIVEASEPCSTGIDFELLYSALTSPEGRAIAEIMK